MLAATNTWTIGHHERGVAAHQQRVAVGWRLRAALGRDVAARAGDVLDHDRLAPGLGELVGEEASGHIRRGAGREADQDAYGLFGVVRLGERVEIEQQQRDERDDYPHSPSPACPESAVQRCTLRRRAG
jgi:hypothetical protein